MPGYQGSLVNDEFLMLVIPGILTVPFTQDEVRLTEYKVSLTVTFTAGLVMTMSSFFTLSTRLVVFEPMTAVGSVNPSVTPDPETLFAEWLGELKATDRSGLENLVLFGRVTTSL